MRASTVRVIFFAVVATSLLLAVTACGSKSSSSSSATDTTTVTDTTAAATDTTPTDTATTDTSTTSSDTSGDVSKSCLNFAGAASKLGQALGTTGSSASSEDLKKYFDGLASKAPGDIKAAFQTLADAVAKYVDGIKGLNLKPGETPSAADLAKLQSAASSLSAAKVQAASTKISAWVKAGCHS